MEFRWWLINQIGGGDLDRFEGFGGNRNWDTITHDIKPLLSHSDCDGELSPEECSQIANGLQQIINNLSDEEKVKDEYYYNKAVKFMEGCKLAASRNETIDFH
jgi:hypothetical protein